MSGGLGLLGACSAIGAFQAESRAAGSAEAAAQSEHGRSNATLSPDNDPQSRQQETKPGVTLALMSVCPLVLAGRR